jgi:hypothetical protein
MVGQYLQEIFSSELFCEFTSTFVKVSTLYMKRVQKFTSKYESLSVLGTAHSKSPAAYSWFWMVLWWVFYSDFFAPYDLGRRDCMGTLEFWPGAPRWIWVQNAIYEQLGLTIARSWAAPARPSCWSVPFPALFTVQIMSLAPLLQLSRARHRSEPIL